MIRRPIIDFSVLQEAGYTNLTTLFIADNSYWEFIEGEPAIIEIITPGAKDPVINYFEQHKINNFNTSNLDLKCHNCNDYELGELPDGIYSITLKGSPENFNKHRYHLRTTKARIDLAKALVNLDVTRQDGYNKEVEEKIHKASLFLDSAEANTMFGKISKAADEYRQAKKIINKINNCKECNH